MNRRGISPIIATVLLIMITIVAVTIIWTMIVPLVNDSFVAGTDCFVALSQISLVEGSDRTCWYENITLGTNISQVNVKRGPQEFDLVNIIILPTFKGGNCDPLIATDFDTRLPGPNEAWNYKIPSGSFVITKVAIAPVVRINGEEVQCDAVDAVEFSECKFS